MSASKAKSSKIKTTGNIVDSPVKQWLKHLGAYIILLFIAMLYFKPVAFDGKSLQQHDNVQALAMQTEMTQYREATGTSIRWSNQFFGGMPTSIIANPNINYINQYVVPPVRAFTTYNEWVSLLLIMFFCYIGLCLMGVNWGVSLAMSAVLGFFTANTLYIGAGHTGKMIVLSSVPLIIGAFVHAYQKNLLLGAALFAAGLSFNICRNHIQMTYYMFFALAIIGLFFLGESAKKNQLPQFGKFAGTMIIASLLGVFSNLGLLWPNYEYGQESTRGKTELTKVKGKDGTLVDIQNKSGLAKDYVFGLSLEKSEIGMLMFPNFYGATQTKSFISIEGSETQQTFRSPKFQQEITNAARASNIKDVSQLANQVARQYTGQYRGSQTMSGGPIYYGVVVCFLFILALLLLNGALKWGVITTFSFFVILAWGQHFELINDFMYNYVPLYAKFRDTKMTLLVAQPLVMLTIGAGLMQLANFDPEKYKDNLSAKILPKLKQTVSKQGYVVLAAVIALGICVLTYLYLSMATLTSPKDIELVKISPSLVTALELDRVTLAKGDILRAIGFILAAVVALILYTKDIIRIEFAAIALAVIACTDLNMVNKEYVNEDSYVAMNYKQQNKAVQAQKSDQKVMKDKSIYRVVDYSRGYPSQNAQASYFHKSMGGYFAAKPLLYQEFWRYYQLDVGDVALKYHSNLMNMLNVKYLIVSPDRAMDNPTALGNAWFVQNIDVVKNADEEIAALDALNPLMNAVVQEKYSDYVKGLETDYSAGDKIYLKTYHPDTMTYQSEATKERFAVFSEMYYPPSKGWNVYIDGVKVDPFVKTNYLLRGLKVPAGKHEIKMVFEPASINVGRQVGAITSLLIIGLLIFVTYLYYKNRVVALDKEA